MGFVPLDKIWRASLPPELIIDDFIEGYKTISYEDYLTEFVNNSSLFLSLSENQIYTHTPKNKQNDGECDCRSRQYELDFKLLGTQSGIYAKRNLSLQKAYLAEGVLASLVPRQLEGMEITITNSLLRRYSLGELLRIDNEEMQKFDRDKLCPKADIKGILKVVKCKKNALFFSTDFIYTDSSYNIGDIIESVQPHINECFSNLFMFREKFVENRDTFFAIIVQGYLCVAVWKEDIIQFEDCIPLSKSPVFSDLYGTLSSAYTTKLIIR